MDILYRIINFFKLKTLDRYIIKKFIGTFFFTILLMNLIFITIDISEKVERFVKSRASLLEITFDYYLNFSILFTNILSNLILFISVVFFTSKLSNKSEIIPIFSAGISYNRFLKPYLIYCVFFSILFFVINAYIVPKSQKIQLDFEDKYINSPDEQRNNLRFKINNAFAYFNNYSLKDNVGKNFSMQEFDHNNQLDCSVNAHTIVWEGRYWMATGVTKFQMFNNGIGQHIDKYDKLIIDLDLMPDDFIDNRRIMGAYNINELYDKISREIARGTGNVNAYKMELYRIYSIPLSVFVLVIIGVTLTSRRSRKDLGLPLGIGLLLCLLYLVLIQFSNIFSIKGNMDPLLATMIPHVIFMGIALYLFITRTKEV
ncbi:MAG: LptF/LptG family permease [Solitalea-like symbiont of Acarus siro]